MPFVSRAGQKLDHAIAAFAIEVAGATCADLGCSTGGFVDCLLQRGAARVFAVDTGYGVLDWKLRNDPRVVVMERTNAMHVSLPEPVDWVSIDVAWTKQAKILPAAAKIVKPGGGVLTLVKPHYEAQPSEADARRLRQRVLSDGEAEAVVQRVLGEIAATGFDVVHSVRSPILGSGGNAEWIAWLKPARS